MINFLAEIAIRFNREIHLTPSNGTPENIISRQNNIYELDINEPEASYWTQWGGNYDNFQGKQIELYLGTFLQKVYTWNDLLTIKNSLYLRSDLIVFINIDNHPWLYGRQSVEAQIIKHFLHSALNPAKPSNNIINDVNTPTLLELPNLTVKLSENINGIALNQGFSISLINNDGNFDNEEYWNIFNTPLRLKKSIVDKASYDDFRDIRVGLVENTVTNFNEFQIDVGDRFRTMDNPACNIITNDRFPGVAIDDKVLNKNIPIVYGRKRVKLQKLNEYVDTVTSQTMGMFIAAEYVSQIIGIYDNDGNILNYPINVDAGIITYGANADSAVIVGYPDNKIGNIIKDIIYRKADILYSNANWNVDEVDRYLQTSSRINITIESGNVKNAIQSILKSDVAFFIQQNDGRFTIRKYGTEYATHIIPSWSVTKKPDKSWGTAQESYFSSCVINYDRDGDTYKSLLYNDRAIEAEDTYRRLVRKEFDTDLTNQTEAAELAALLSDRYSVMMQTIKVAVGIDVSGFELLDRVVFGAGINDRKFSKGEIFFIKEIDPAQDTLVLEELYIWDITGEYPETSHEYDVDNMYAQTQDDEFAYFIDGGTL